MSGSSVLGGPYNGHSSKQTVSSKRDSESAIARKVLRSSWNTPYATGTYEGEKRVITPFRAVNNLGDFLGRKNYSCGGPKQMTFTCDSSNVPASSTNVKFVPDSSDYIRFRKQQAMNRNYNDSAH
ncbi:hypothetical protein OAS95_02630 [Pelagibacteraceae bacterium]|jgi:hypothetical protein|nr:hypothetical protein [Pelagibacteraceae bacterium]